MQNKRQRTTSLFIECNRVKRIKHTNSSLARYNCFKVKHSEAKYYLFELSFKGFSLFMIWCIAKKLLRVTVGPIRCIGRAKKQQNEAMQKKVLFSKLTLFWVVVTLAYLASIYYITIRAKDVLLFLFAHRCLNGEFCYAGSWYTDACK